jgi:hypothetical protein
MGKIGGGATIGAAVDRIGNCATAVLHGAWGATPAHEMAVTRGTTRAGETPALPVGQPHLMPVAGL